MSLRASMRSRAFRQLYRPTPHALRASTSSTSFRIVDTCPSPTCPCSDTPQMPEGLEIDYKKPLNGTMASFAEQVVICTGTSDWKSNIVEDNSGDNLAADLKELLGRGGVYSDVSLLNVVIILGLEPLLTLHSHSTMFLFLIHLSLAQSLPGQKSKLLPRISFRASNISRSYRASRSTACKRLLKAISYRLN
jgi:hypothetical protein